MTAPRIKICGVTLADDAARVAAAGVDFIGLNFWPESKRYLDPERAPLIAQVAKAHGEVRLVGVFVDPDVDYVVAVCGSAALDAIQLHGDEDPALCNAIARAVGKPVWKAIAVASGADVQRLGDWPVETIVLDAPAPTRGGAGVRFDWRHARVARERFPNRAIVLAGGLDAGNVANAIAQVDPWAIDVASGVEVAPGVKDPGKLAAFVAAARGAS
jgi:phosphoribosylanthranilate isomerase